MGRNPRRIYKLVNSSIIWPAISHALYLQLDVVCGGSMKCKSIKSSQMLQKETCQCVAKLKSDLFPIHLRCRRKTGKLLARGNRIIFNALLP